MSDSWQADGDELLEALRADLPSAGERERVRAKLAAAGVLAVSAATPASVAAMSGGAGASSGLVQKLSAWSWPSKMALAAAVSAAAIAPPAFVLLSPRRPAEQALVTVAQRRPAQASPMHAEAVAVERAASSRASGIDGIVGSGDRLAVGAPLLVPVFGSAAAVRPRRVALSKRALTIREAQSPDLATVVAVPEAPTAASSDASPPPFDPALIAQPPVTAGEPPRLPAAAASAAATTPQLTAAGPEAPQPTAASAPRFYAAPQLAAPQLAGGRRSPPSELAQETKLIERALAALSVHDVRAARSWLKLHALHYHDGHLRRERERVLRRIDELPATDQATQTKGETHER